VTRPVVRVFLLALFVRLLYFATARGVAFEIPLVDADYYDMLGEAAGKSFGSLHAPFRQPPLYPALLGIAYKIAGHTLWAPRILQALMGAGTAALTHEIARALGAKPRVALFAGAAVALHGPLVFYDGELLPTSLATFLGTLALWLALRPEPSRAISVAIGATIGFASLAVAPMLLLLFPLSWRARPLLCAMVCLLTIAPVTLANHRATGEWIAISANGGVNLLIGNNPDIDRAMTIRPGARWEDLIHEPERHGIRTPGAQDAYFTGKAVHFCTSEPAACAKNLFRKVRLALLARELPRNEDLYTLTSQSPVLSLLNLKVGSFALPNALLLPLAVLGLFDVARRKERPGNVAMWALLSIAIVSVVFFASGRYRAPAAPLLCVFAAIGGAALWRRVRAPQSVEVWTPEIVASAVLMVSVWPLTLPLDDVDYAAEVHFAAGGRLARLADDVRAVEQWSQALERRPTYMEAAYNMALAQERLGRLGDAAATYERILTFRDARTPADVTIRLADVRRRQMTE